MPQLVEVVDRGVEHRDVGVLLGDVRLAGAVALGHRRRHQGRQQPVVLGHLGVQQLLLGAEAGAHVVERGREVGELVLPPALHPGVEVAAGDLAHPADEPVDRTGEHAGEQQRGQRDDQDDAERGQPEGAQQVAHRAERLVHVDLADHGPADPVDRDRGVRRSAPAARGSRSRPRCRSGPAAPPGPRASRRPGAGSGSCPPRSGRPPAAACPGRRRRPGRPPGPPPAAGRSTAACRPARRGSSRRSAPSPVCAHWPFDVITSLMAVEGSWTTSTPVSRPSTPIGDSAKPIGSVVGGGVRLEVDDADVVDGVRAQHLAERGLQPGVLVRARSAGWSPGRRPCTRCRRRCRRGRRAGRRRTRTTPRPGGRTGGTSRGRPTRPSRHRRRPP